VWGHTSFLVSIIIFYIINVESEQNRLLNFIMIDQCKSVLFYRTWKKKIIWNYFMSTYISNFHQYILKKNYILQIFNLHFIFNFCFSQLKKEQYILFFLIILIPMTDCTCTSKWSIFYYLLSRIETTRSHGTRLILTPGKMYS
jgi:hypothetical protein